MPKTHLRFFAFTSVIFLFLSICSFIPDQRSAETFARDLFNTIQKGDSVAFRNHFITEKEFAQVLDSCTWSNEKKMHSRAKLTQHFLDSAITAVYDKIKFDQDTVAVSWPSAKIDSLNCRINSKEGMTELNMHIYFNAEKRSYCLSGSKILLTAGGWKVANGLSLNRQTPDR